MIRLLHSIYTYSTTFITWLLVTYLVYLVFVFLAFYFSILVSRILLSSQPKVFNDFLGLSLSWQILCPLLSFIYLVNLFLQFPQTFWKKRR